VNPAILIFAVLFAVAGYQEARRFARQHGATPWGWDPWIWAVVMLLSWLIGVILLAIAERQGRHRARQVTARAWPGSTPSVFAAAAPSASLGYASGLAPATAISGPGVVPQTAPAVAPSEGRWAVDPSGRHHYRWWNGREWTSAVATNGVQAHDPV
jgi:Protein of unknown function (DUF2510)